jgi:hypothetical protein
VAFLDCSCGTVQVVDGDEDVVELRHRSASRQSAGFLRV